MDVDQTPITGVSFVERWGSPAKAPPLDLPVSMVVSAITERLGDLDTDVLNLPHRALVSPDTLGAFGMRDHPMHGDRRMHNGVDLAAPRGSEIGAVRAGKVLRVKRSEQGYGNQVMVDHGEGLVSRYAHCQDIFVKVGDQLEAGQLLGTVGSSGDSTGPHLHLEVHVDGQAVDPVPYMPEGSVVHSDHDSHR